MKLRVLDLFSGTQSVKKALDERWPHWEYTSGYDDNGIYCQRLKFLEYVYMIIYFS